MSQLRLQNRDDPLAINQDRAQTSSPVAAPAAAANQSTSTVDNGQARRRATRRRAPATSGTTTTARRRRTTPTPKPPEASDRSYDEDRLEQTGWRIYESLLADVRTRAEELTVAGIPTSAAALAAATLHSHLPRTVEEGTDLMRVYRQASAGRRRARTAS